MVDDAATYMPMYKSRMRDRRFIAAVSEIDGETGGVDGVR